MNDHQPLQPASSEFELTDLFDTSSCPAANEEFTESALFLPLCKDWRGETDKVIEGSLSDGMLLLPPSMLSC